VQQSAETNQLLVTLYFTGYLPVPILQKKPCNRHLLFPTRNSTTEAFTGIKTLAIAGIEQLKHLPVSKRWRLLAFNH